MDKINRSILIVEDDITFGKLLQVWFTKKGYAVDVAVKATDAKKKMKEAPSDVVICDLRLPGEDGLSVLAWIKNEYPKTVVIMMTGYADVQSAVSAIKLGAFDYISKPFNPEQLFEKINEALEKELQAEQDATAQKKENKTPKNKFVQGASEAYQELYRHVDLVAPTRFSVLIKGESGVGKEHIARMIHDKSDVASGPFVAVDCGVLMKDLAGSDLFGHIKGAFTGALTDKTGSFVRADKGTLFLDEIGNLPIDVQVQLLRALQERRVRPVGSEKEIKVDVRVIAATNEDIEFASENGYFRADLLHRICEFILDVPSLKDSNEDIPQFLNHFLRKANRSLGKKIAGFSPEALDVLVNYEWPGNVRELKNIVNRLTLLETGSHISLDIIPEHFKSKKKLPEKTISQSVEEKQRIEDALRITGFNILRTSALLDIEARMLYAKMKLYDISYA